MSPFILALALAGAASAQVPTAPGAAALTSPKLEGDWNIVYAESGGQRWKPEKSSTITIRGNVLTYTQGEQTHSFRLEFGPDQRVAASETEEVPTGRLNRGPAAGPFGSGPSAAAVAVGTHHGVYIMSQDYFCLSFDPTGTAGSVPITNPASTTTMPVRPGIGTTSPASRPQDNQPPTVPIPASRPGMGGGPGTGGTGATRPANDLGPKPNVPEAGNPAGLVPRGPGGTGAEPAQAEPKGQVTFPAVPTVRAATAPTTGNTYQAGNLVLILRKQ